MPLQAVVRGRRPFSHVSHQYITKSEPSLSSICIRVHLCTTRAMPVMRCSSCFLRIEPQYRSCYPFGRDGNVSNKFPSRFFAEIVRVDCKVFCLQFRFLGIVGKSRAGRSSLERLCKTQDMAPRLTAGGLAGTVVCEASSSEELRHLLSWF